jgi:hypothetical protein
MIFVLVGVLLLLFLPPIVHAIAHAMTDPKMGVLDAEHIVNIEAQKRD